MESEASKSKRSILMGIGSLTPAERRYRRWVFRLIVYVDAAAFIVPVIVFHEFWLIVPIWVVTSVGLFAWFIVAQRRAIKKGLIIPPPDALRIEMSERMPFFLVSSLVGICGFLLVSFYTLVALIPAGILVITTTLIFVWYKRLR